jgi:hypothetical protein
MSSLQTHPEEGLLLRYLDGELPGRKSRQVRGHLEACWQCRSAVEELEGAIAACMEYRKEVLQGHLPPPPTPWADLTAGFARIDSEVAADGWGIRLGNWLTGPRLQRFALTAAAVGLVAVGVYYQVLHTPSVQAATMLRRAVAVSATPAPAKPVRMRGNFTSRTAIASKLRAAHYPDGDPLNPKSFQQWRDSLPQKQDEVATVSNPEIPSESWFRIKTTPVEGELAAASLTLRASDFHPVGSRFEFRDQEWVEYNEFSETPATDGGTPAVSRLDAPTRRVVPSRPSALPSGESASISEELRVLAALHEIGADLGDPLDITRSGGKVLVSGVGVPAGRQREIHRALDPLSNVTVQFADPGTGAASSAVETSEVRPDSAGRSPIQTRLEQQLGSRAAFERFSSQTLDVLDNAMAHAYALRSLAQRFPEGVAMSDNDRALLADLARAHLKTLSSQINELHRTLAPALVSLGGATAQGRPASNARAWQTAAEDTFAASRRVEVLLSTLVGATTNVPNAQVPSDLLAAFADLRTAIEECQKRL